MSTKPNEKVVKVLIFDFHIILLYRDQLKTNENYELCHFPI